MRLVACITSAVCLTLEACGCDTAKDQVRIALVCAPTYSQVYRLSLLLLRTVMTLVYENNFSARVIPRSHLQRQPSP
ncbi:hypothetical protein FB567DRAFT_41729 [Paraphoma chrysanthemicola]|uniref:Uncharacterized protein n=1 Tax=Paraphoma chrysanthemicola TaxID=798071 RepID=A0A8K0RL65_9PLEO|nr:hypothetical protein FB567DRAFT_41729 [Paraphoma chrysanthemicola]